MSIRIRAAQAATALLVTLGALHAGAAGGAAPPKGRVAPEVAVFEDGLELVTWPQPGARRAALWIVVRTGGTSDPPGKAGLAHLVEHLALGGSHDVGGRAFMDEARGAGATVNAHTYPERITFELDAPADRFDALAARFLRLVTSPAWEDAMIASERGIIETEAAYHATEGLLSLVDLAVFPAPAQGGPLIGTEESRSRLDMEDVAAFFARNMVPANISVVVTGATTPARSRALVEEAFRIPPARPGEAGALPREPPSLPVEQKLQAGVVVTMAGYLLDPGDRALCPAVASLLDLRLKLAVQLANERVSAVSVGCHRLRGNDFLIAFAFTSTLDTGDLPQRMQRAITGLGAELPTARERQLIDGRLSREFQRALGDPAALADRVSVVAAERIGPRTDLAGLRAAPLPAATRLGALVRRSFTEERRVLLSITPMQN